MTFDQMVADRIASLAMDASGSTSDDAGASWLDGYSQAVADLQRGALPADALQLARDIRVQFCLLRGMYLRGDERAIASIFRVVEVLTCGPAFATLTARELRLFWAIATA